jgi:hypothetical protein
LAGTASSGNRECVFMMFVLVLETGMESVHRSDRRERWRAAPGAG